MRINPVQQAKSEEADYASNMKKNSRTYLVRASLRAHITATHLRLQHNPKKQQPRRQNKTPTKTAEQDKSGPVNGDRGGSPVGDIRLRWTGSVEKLSSEPEGSSECVTDGESGEQVKP